MLKAIPIGVLIVAVMLLCWLSIVLRQR
jgi:hypothetical protein